MVQLVSARVLICPLPYCLEHLSLNVNFFVAEDWVVEGVQNIVHNLIHGHVGVLPRIKNTAMSYC